MGDQQRAAAASGFGRRTVLAGGAAVAGLAFAEQAQAGFSPRKAAASGSTPADRALTARLNVLFDEELALSPEALTGLGLDKGARAGAKSRLDDRSPAGRAAYVAQAKKVLDEMARTDPARLGAAGRRNREIVQYKYRQQLVSPEQFDLDSVQLPYLLSQQGGAYFNVPDFLTSQHTIENAADAQAFLARLAQFGAVLDQQSAEQARQAAKGRLAPGWSLDLVLGQMRKLRGGAAADNFIAAHLAAQTQAKGLAGDWREQAARILEREVFPALDRQIALVEKLRATTPEGDGAWRMPGGDAIHAAALAEATTTTLDAETIHRMGLEQVADLTRRLDEVLKAGGYTTGSVAERLTALNQAADQRYPDSPEGRAELIAGLNARLADMAARLPRAFAGIPNEKLEVRRVPPEIQDGASNGYYYSAALDGSRPAIYWINLKDMGDWPKYSLPTLTWHEGLPGHHLQGGYARTDANLPLMLQNYFISSYGEGWALYAEQLADEMGANKGLERAGFLQSLLFRAARLVVDTGIHHHRWSREKATDYMVSATGFARPRLQREVERYCVMIGQACSYKIGHSAWVASRAKAQAALGDKFSLPWFHAILSEGVMPISMLQARIDERVRERLTKG